jgi:protein-tyrosine phosphatase
LSGYIDLHNHILHNIDDGPATLSESVFQAQAMVEAGYSTVVVTPHVVEGEPVPQVILERLRELQQELDRRQINLTLLPGAEHHIEPRILERLQADQGLTLAGSRYLLLELPFNQPLPIYTEKLIHDLTAKGYCAVIPHPERTAALQVDTRLIHRLHQSGAIYQLTWGALTGRLGPRPEKTARHIIEAKVAHLFATDAHNFDGRLQEVEKATARLADLLGSDKVDSFLRERPLAVINDQPLNLEPAGKPLPQKSKKFTFFKRSH